MLKDFYIDERTGKVRRVMQFHESPEVSRLNKKRAIIAKLKRKSAKLARRKNRR